MNGITDKEIRESEKLIKKSICHAYNKGLQTGIEATQTAFKMTLINAVTNIADRELCIDAIEYIKEKAIKDLSLTEDNIEIEFLNLK